MQGTLRFSLFLICCSTLVEFAQNFLGFLGMDFVFGVLLYGRFLPLFLLGFSLMCGFGLLYHFNYLIKFLCDFRVKSSELGDGFCSERASGEVCASKDASCESEPLISVENLHSQNTDDFVLAEIVEAENVIERKDDHVEESDDESVSSCKEDQVYDVVSLRRLVKMERRRGNLARVELNKERMAAASAAEEAMAMILRLQNEKSSTEIQANYHRQIAEQRQQYDEEMIQALQWIIMKQESERRLLEEQLRLCRRKCNDQFEEGDDPSTNLFASTYMDMENDGLEDVFPANCRYFESE